MEKFKIEKGVLVKYTGNGGDVVIPEGVRIIGEYAFVGCTNLTSVVIPDSVTSIGECSFKNCSSLTSITIPDSVTTIGEEAFCGCYKLTTVNYLGTVDQWAQIEFADETSNPMVYAEVLQINGKEITEIMLTTATKISKYSFYCFNKLAKITIPKCVTSIGEYAFYHCRNLTSVVIPDSVTSIGDSAFEDCTSLKTVTFGKNSRLTSIGYGAFYNCTSLTEIVIPSSVTSIGGSAFYGCTSLTIYCKAESKPGGWSAGWSAGCPVVWGDRLPNYFKKEVKTMTTLKINNIIINVGKDVVINIDEKAEIDINNEVIEITTFEE